METTGLSDKETQRLVHEIEVHQIELEVQGEQLRQAQTELETIKDRYVDLYDFAPAGYVAVAKCGRILEANLTLCRPLGVVRETLIGKPFSRFIFQENQDSYYLLERHLLAGRIQRACEFRLVHGNEKTFCAQPNASIADCRDGKRCCRMIVSDITHRKRMEEARDERDLVVVDLLVPKMGGEKCVEGLLTIDPHVKVVVSTEHSLSREERERFANVAKTFVN